ncbi:hypothetical protein [Mesorhizobium sp. ES1-3]|uniref:hypothetical protein n=2 Tax=Mesorhizobium TaxID=68287 RepID=UPI001CC9FCE5|nr:hypothetical protein [Mesorhizobium sp. ES1-3]
MKHPLASETRGVEVNAGIALADAVGIHEVPNVKYPARRRPVVVNPATHKIIKINEQTYFMAKPVAPNGGDRPTYYWIWQMLRLQFAPDGEMKDSPGDVQGGPQISSAQGSINPPRRTEDHPDRWIECQGAIQPGFHALVDSMLLVGWTRGEVLRSLKRLIAVDTATRKEAGHVPAELAIVRGKVQQIDRNEIEGPALAHGGCYVARVGGQLKK